jgi:5-methylcytosine-specific restriction endonuclease McrA
LNCANCSKETKNPKFCSRECAGVFNNTGRKHSLESRLKRSKKLMGRPGWALGTKQTPERIARRLAAITPETRKQAAIKIKQKARIRLEERFSLLEQDEDVPEYILRLYLLEKFGKCMKCKLSEWMGEPLMLELHHVNGNDKNNILSNSELLCPNCHSQTHNFRNRKRPNGGMHTQQLQTLPPQGLGVQVSSRVPE